MMNNEMKITGLLLSLAIGGSLMLSGCSSSDQAKVTVPQPVVPQPVIPRTAVPAPVVPQPRDNSAEN